MTFKVTETIYMLVRKLKLVFINKHRDVADVRKIQKRREQRGGGGTSVVCCGHIGERMATNVPPMQYPMTLTSDSGILSVVITGIFALDFSTSDWREFLKFTFIVFLLLTGIIVSLFYKFTLNQILGVFSEKIMTSLNPFIYSRSLNPSEFDGRRSGI